LSLEGIKVESFDKGLSFGFIIDIFE